MKPHPSTRTSELQATELEGDKSIAVLDDVDESVELVRSEDEEVPTGDTPPATHHQISAEVLLEHPSQVLVEKTVQTVWVGI